MLNGIWCRLKTSLSPGGNMVEPRRVVLCWLSAKHTSCTSHISANQPQTEPSTLAWVSAARDSTSCMFSQRKLRNTYPNSMESVCTSWMNDPGCWNCYLPTVCIIGATRGMFHKGNISAFFWTTHQISFPLSIFTSLSSFALYPSLCKTLTFTGKDKKKPHLNVNKAFTAPRLKR